ncbi:PucR family transcriptional regulator [Oceanobacillus alkalisoli]|uniref:PucR family transcriptional regulator n=1 Tax=Oceanobacillus alkalisoli TaxID=2925113 RepID=UPI001EEFCF89|nr:PucR family transcriptional regulator [Oceanobacillus alkalisoli]MCF3944513.1 PucR family transcriptional regulator [Oceanobacillus alkalisoli]MCG5103361.1 PucR family transcriptional regulator [Oceanobacillus alkalisoli]
MENFKVTVKDILKRRLFKNATLITGGNGVGREITWTHILEMEAFDSFINGGELILTTGSNMPLDSKEGIPKLKKLIELEVAALCIELGTHVQEIEPVIIAFANEHDFPIIIFRDVVKFVDITQDLHTILINSHHEQLKYLHDLSNVFNELSLEPNGVLKILKKLHESFNLDVVLVSDDKQLFYYPLKNKEQAETILSLIDTEREVEPYHEVLFHDDYYTVFPIKGLGSSWGDLYIQERSAALDEFSFSIIDRATLAIAQIMLRNKTIEERKQNQEENLVQQLLHGEEYESTAALKFLPAPAENLYYRLIMIENSSYHKEMRDEDWEEIKLQQSIILRSIFKRHNFFPAISITKNNIAVIASYYKSSYANSDIDIFTIISEAIKKSNKDNIFRGKNSYIGISSLQKDYAKLNKCYAEANAVLAIQKMDILDILFFEDIGIYRLLMNLPKHELEAYVFDYLEPLLDHSRQTKNDLLLTLAVYLETMGSKKETSERLSIVRQTLYHRLEKIEELMGEDFMKPTNRQAIELAIGAYALLGNKVN